MYVITNGLIIAPEGIIHDHILVIKENRIEAIVDKAELSKYADYKELDVKGEYISPGFIDTHSDYIEKIVSPRPSALMDFMLAIKETERLLMTHGITTMFHSLSLYNDTLFSKNKVREPKHAERMIRLINDIHDQKHLIRHRVHARYEIDNLQLIDLVSDLIREGKVHYLSLMDHTPGQGQYTSIANYRQTILNYGSVDEEHVDEAIAQRSQTEKLTFEQANEMVKVAHENGIAVASHDDDTLEKLAVMQELKMDISEFPITLEVAKAAKEKGLWTVGGAPNILIGGSHSGNLSVAEAILADAMDIICSDYYPSGMVNAVFKMHFDYGVPLHEMINRLTYNPAQALKMKDFGCLREGYIADLITIDVDENNYPVVTSTFVGGVPVFRTKYRKGGKAV